MSKWREKYKVHPAAAVFPMMSDEELAALGEDIKKNGLKGRVTGKTGITVDCDCVRNSEIGEIEDNINKALFGGGTRH